MIRRFALVLLLLQLVASPARAQSSAAAQALFDQGQNLMKAGKIAEACPKFEESLRLEQALGTVLNLAECYKQAGKTASAWSKFADAAAMARATGQTQREEFAMASASQLEPKLARITITVSHATQGVAGLTVRRDDDPVGSAQWGLEVPVDPGVHQISAEAPSHETWRQKVTLAEAARINIEVPALRAAAAPPPTEPTSTTGPSPTQEPPRAQPPSRTLAIVGMVVGGVGIVASGVLGLVAKSKHDSAVESGDCTGNACNDAGYEARGEAVTMGNIATVCGVVGVVALGGGITLWLTAEPAETAATAKSSNLALGLRGQW